MGFCSQLYKVQAASVVNLGEPVWCGFFRVLMLRTPKLNFIVPFSNSHDLFCHRDSDSYAAVAEP